MEGLFPFLGEVLATASCEQTNDDGDQAEDKREADDQTAEQSLVTGSHVDRLITFCSGTQLRRVKDV